MIPRTRAPYRTKRLPLGWTFVPLADAQGRPRVALMPPGTAPMVVVWREHWRTALRTHLATNAVPVQFRAPHTVWG